ncbi:hypothetical protein [Streptacidiphilus sp. MAP12-16]|uniref:hypothetical protein n=1 Tax=Streptacidiphilus sp. MAP12-16 TaxID=3156300 RepID=UPI0035112563
MLTQLGHRQMVQERSQQGAVAQGEHGSADLALQNGELVAQRKNLNVLVTVAHRQQTYEGEGVRHRNVDQSQHKTIMPLTYRDPVIIRTPDRAIPARRLQRPSGR